MTGTTENADDELSPDPLEAFVGAFNVAYPEWEVNGDPDKDLTTERVDYSDRLHTYHARCGVTGFGRPLFKVNTSVWKRFSTEEQVRLLAHELAHINHFDHSPDFWFNAGKNVERFIQNKDEMEEVMGDSISWTAVIEDMVKNPNRDMVDRRQNTVYEQRMELAEQLGYRGLEPFSGMRMYRGNNGLYTTEKVRVSDVDFDLWPPERVLNEVWHTRPREGIELNRNGTYTLEPVGVVEGPDGSYIAENDGLMSLAYYTMGNDKKVNVDVVGEATVEEVTGNEKEAAD